MTDDTHADALSRLLAPYAERVERDLTHRLVEDGCPDPLAEAMRYAVLGGGKRIRPALVHLSAEAGGGGEDELTARAAVAVELAHCYSLVHDDLPAMDDDVLRRGRPTVHVKFGDAMAILVGDALLTRAFGVLAEATRDASCGADERPAALVRELAIGVGAAGMIAGQAADMGLVPLPAGREGLDWLHRRKTGALIAAACRMGAICARADQEVREALGCFGERLGLAFQATDDVLDVTASAAQLGKTPGKDASAGKRTYVSELGLERAAALGEEWTRSAVAALEPLGDHAQTLRELATLLARRKH